MTNTESDACSLVKAEGREGKAKATDDILKNALTFFAALLNEMKSIRTPISRRIYSHIAQTDYEVHNRFLPTKACSSRYEYRETRPNGFPNAKDSFGTMMTEEEKKADFWRRLRGEARPNESPNAKGSFETTMTKEDLEEEKAEFFRRRKAKARRVQYL